MNRQRGVSSLAMVLMLLVLGSLMLQGLNQAQRRQLQIVTDESRALQNSARVHSALQWGKQQKWLLEVGGQCLKDENASQVCLRLFSDGTLLLIAQHLDFRLWQSGHWSASGIHFSPHGWSDFCPLKEKTLCLLP